MYLNVGPWRYDVKVTDRALLNSKGETVDGLAVDHQRTLWLAESARGERRLEVFGHEAYHAFEYHFGVPKSAEDRANFHASVTAAIQQCLAKFGGTSGLEQLKPDIDVPSENSEMNDSDSADPELSSSAIPGSSDPIPTFESLLQSPPAPEVVDSMRPSKTAPSPVRGNVRRPDPTDEQTTMPVRVIDVRPWRTWLSQARVRLPRNGMQWHAPVGAQIDGRQATAPPSMPRDNRCCARCERLIAGGQIVDGPVFMSNLGPAIQRTLYCDLCRHLQRWIESAWPDGSPAGQCLQPEPEFVGGPEVQTFLEEHPEARMDE